MHAPATFQNMLDILLAGFCGRSCLVYLDDFIVYSKDAKNHINDVEYISTAFRGAGLSLQLRNCRNFRQNFEYLGHILKPGELLSDPKNTAGLAETKPTRRNTELRFSLDMANVVREFVNGLAKIGGFFTQLF